MNECQFQLDHVAKLAKFEAEISELKMRTEVLEDIRESNIKLATLIEFHISDEKKREAMMEKQQELLSHQQTLLSELSGAVVKVNENLDGLNKEVKNVKDSQSQMEQKIDKRISDIECKFNTAEEKNKIDIREAAKKFFMKYFFPGSFIVGALYAILKLLKVLP